MTTKAEIAEMMNQRAQTVQRRAIAQSVVEQLTLKFNGNWSNRTAQNPFEFISFESPDGENFEMYSQWIGAGEDGIPTIHRDKIATFTPENLDAGDCKVWRVVLE